MARVTVHLNGKRRGTPTPAIRNIAGRSTLAREAVEEAARLQHVKAGDAIGSMVTASFDTHWGSMVRTYHPEHDTPDAHEAQSHIDVNGRIAKADVRVTTPKHIRRMVMQRDYEQEALAAKRAQLRALTAMRPVLNSLRLDND